MIKLTDTSIEVERTELEEYGFEDIVSDMVKAYRRLDAEMAKLNPKMQLKILVEQALDEAKVMGTSTALVLGTVRGYALGCRISASNENSKMIDLVMENDKMKRKIKQLEKRK